MFNRQQYNTIAQAMLDALRPVEEQFGVRISRENGTYGNGMSIRFQVARINADGVAQTRERIDFRKYAAQYGLEANMLDQEFDFSGDTFRISGLNTRASKRPIIVESLRSQKSYSFPAADIARLLHSKSPPGPDSAS